MVNVTGDAGPENTGFPSYQFDDDCRLVGIAHEDKVFKIVGGNKACYKILRTWYFADWRFTGGIPLNGTWWNDSRVATESRLQKIIVIDTLPPQCAITGPVGHGESIEVGACVYDLEVAVTTMDPCGLKNYRWELKNVGVSDHLLVDQGSGDLDGDEANFSLESSDLADGSYVLKIIIQDECNNESYCEYNFETVSVKKPNPVCVTSLTAALTHWDSDGDGISDTSKAVIWAEEFDRSSSASCQDTALEFRIELLRGDDSDLTFEEDADSLVVGCDDIGGHIARLWTISLPSNTHDFCDVVLIVQSNANCGSTNGPAIPLSETVKIEEEKEMNAGMRSDFQSKAMILGRKEPFKKKITGDYFLAQNIPNPFRAETQIEFILPKSMDATIKLYDVTGKTLRTIRSGFPKGLNQIRFRKEDLNIEGVVYYQLKTVEFTETKKMIIIN